jgi:YidC/Oxa1 family membrane protein insertase
LNIFTQFVDYFADALKAIANFYNFLGGHKWAAAIITMTIIVRTLLLPLAIKQIKSMREQQRLQPEIQRLRQKYRSDRQAMNQELMALYQREGVNPMAACLPMFLQFPVLIAMYGALRRFTAIPIDELKKIGSYASEHHLTLVEAAKKLKIKAPMDKLEQIGEYASKHHESVLRAAQHLHIVERMPFLGLGDLSNQAASSIAGWLLIVLMTVISFLSTLQFNMGQTEQQKRMQLLMPLFFVVLFIRYPAALLLYWTTQQLYQFVQQTLMTRDMREGSGWRSLFPSLSLGERSDKKPAARAQQKQLRPAVAAAGGAPASLEQVSARRDLEEKRRRRRNRKKKKRRR